MTGRELYERHQTHFLFAPGQTDLPSRRYEGYERSTGWDLLEGKSKDAWDRLAADVTDSISERALALHQASAW